MIDPDDIPTLTDTESTRWQATAAMIDAMSDGVVDGSIDADELMPMINQIGQLDLDPMRFADSMHIPVDAGPYHGALMSIMTHIPDGWGRWISCDAGWYPLIARLHAELLALDADYVVHQVKEKFGALRFYADTDDDEVRERLDTLITVAEHQSAQICERCSSPAHLCAAQSGQRRRYKTLCPACIGTVAADNGHRYTPLPSRGNNHDR